MSTTSVNPSKFLFVLIVLILSSCGKSKKIKCGKPNRMIVTQHSVELKGEINIPDSLDFDLDGDGEQDLRLISVLNPSQGFGEVSYVKAKCLHSDFALWGELDDKTIYFGSGTQVYTENQVLYSMDYIRRSCSASSNDDSIVTYYNNFYVRPKYEGDPLSREGEFRPWDAYLMTSPMLVSDGMDNVTPDTTFQTGNLEIDDCYNFPQNEKFYLGFKFGYNRLGWLEMQITDNNRVVVDKSAVRKYY